MSNTIENLKQDPGCLFIYNLDFSIYGIPEKERYVVVVQDDWEPNGLDLNPSVYMVHTMSSWFKMVLNNDLLCWQCSCLNRKYIIKEHVKLMLIPDPLQLRKQIDREMKYLLGVNDWQLVCDIKFVNQIIENHKIVNFKEAASDYKILQSEEKVDVVSKPYNYLKKLTDGMLKQDQIKNMSKHE